MKVHTLKFNGKINNLSANSKTTKDLMCIAFNDQAKLWPGSMLLQGRQAAVGNFTANFRQRQGKSLSNQAAFSDFEISVSVFPGHQMPENWFFFSGKSIINPTRLIT